MRGRKVKVNTCSETFMTPVSTFTDSAIIRYNEDYLLLKFGYHFVLQVVGLKRLFVFVSCHNVMENWGLYFLLVILVFLQSNKRLF